MVVALDLVAAVGLYVFLAGERPRLFREVPADRWERDGRRWFLTKLISADHPAGPMLRRYMIFQGDRFGVYVHQIFRPDADRDTHDHPWPFRSLVLRGGYSEEVRLAPGADVSSEVWRGRGRAHVMPTYRSHRIVQVRPRTWTLLVVGPKMREWGFWVPPARLPGYVARPGNCTLRWVPWREYGALTADPMDS